MLAINPERPEALIGLRPLLLAARRTPASAQSLLFRCCGVAPGRAEAWDALGLALMMTGDAPTRPSRRSRRRMRLAPRMPRLRPAPGRGCAGGGFGRGRTGAIGGRQRARSARWRFAHGARACCWMRLGRLAEAADALEAARALDPVASRGVGARRASWPRSAGCRRPMLRLRRALALDPEIRSCGNNRAAVLMRLHRTRRRGICCAICSRVRDRNPALLCNLANATLSLGRQEEAEGIARRGHRARARRLCCPAARLCNALPYRDGATARSAFGAPRLLGAAAARPAPPFCQ